MKKTFLFLSIIILVFLSSCTYNQVDSDTDVPYSVMDSVLVVDSTSLECFYIIDTGKNHFYFNDDKKLVEKYTTHNEKVTLNIYFLVFLFIAVFFIGLIWGLSNSNY